MNIRPFTSIKTDTGWYKMIKYIGMGGNGTAFLVMCTAGPYKGELFAMKVFHNILDDVRRERFLSEIRFMKDKHHPSIMRQYDEGTFTQGKASFPFVIMEYIPNTLQYQLKKEISLGNALLYALQLLSAIKYIHQYDVVHRDIKPSNIFIHNHSAILGDFGLIKKIDIVDPNDIDVINGYYAMAKNYPTPELIGYAKGECGVCKESDIFQLGLVLSHLFCKKYPLYKNQYPDKISIKKLEVIYPEYDGLIAKVIIRMLSLDRNNRIDVETALNEFNMIFETYSKKQMELGLSII